MPRSPTSLAFASLALAWAGTASAADAPGAAGATCGPAVELSTPQPTLAQALLDALARRGVQSATPGCPAIDVQIEADGSGLRMAQGDGPAQAVPDIETAALLVETWVRADLIDPLLAARRGPPPPPLRPITLDFGVDGALGEDGTSWVGARVEGCITLGWICPGVRLRGLFDPGLTGGSDQAGVWRMGLGAMATGDLVFGDLRAGVGVGVAVTRTDGDRGIEDASGAPLLELRVGHAFDIGDRWALEASVAGDLALWHHRAQDELGAQDLPDLPRFMVLAGVGARWSAP